MSQQIVLKYLKKQKGKKKTVSDIEKGTGLNKQSIRSALRMLYKKWGLLQREEVSHFEIYWKVKE